MAKLYVHPCYNALQRKWRTYWDLYDGDHDTLVSLYLWKHVVETTTKGAKLRGIREERTQYTNFVEPCISAWTSLLFKEDPNVEGLKKEDVFTDEELANIDGTGKSLVQFIKEDVVRNYFLYGKPLILTDAVATKAKNSLDERLLGQRPFWEVINPINVPDWVVEGGGYRSFRYEYIQDAERESVEAQPKQELLSKLYTIKGTQVEVKRFRKRDADARKKSKSDDSGEWELVGEPILLPIDHVPVSTLWNQDSWIKDIAPLALSAFNLESVIDNILNNQGYQRVILAGELGEKEWMEIGESVFGKAPAGTTLLQLEPVDTSSVERRYDKLVINIHKIAFDAQRVMPADSKAVEGAGTQIERKDSMVSLLQSSLVDIEDVVNRAVKDWATFKNKPDFDGKIEFSHKIADEDVLAQAQLFLQFKSDIMRSKVWYQESLKQVAKAQDLGKLDEIYKDIQAMEPPQPLIEQRPGFGNRPPLTDRLQQVANGNAQSGSAQSANQ